MNGGGTAEAPGRFSFVELLGCCAAVVGPQGELLAANAPWREALGDPPELPALLRGPPGEATAPDGQPTTCTLGGATWAARWSPLSAAAGGGRLLCLSPARSGLHRLPAELLYRVIDGLPINVFVKDAAGVLVMVNAETVRTLGRAAEEVLGRTDHDLFGAEVADRIVATDRAVLGSDSGEDLLHEEQIDSGDVQRDMLAGKVRLSGPDGAPYLLGFSIDITERKRIERELEAQRNFIRQVIDTDPNLIFVKDRRNNFRLVNQAVATLFGKSVDAIEDQSNAVVHDNEEEVEGYGADDRRVIDLGVTVQKEETVTQSDGRIHHYQTTKVPLRFSNGEVMALAISVDITERLRHLAEVRAARDAAEAASRAKTDFLATMSHEIRTPMNGVIGMTGLLLDSGLGPVQRRYAETIRESGEALLSIINDILDFSKVEAGHIELEESDYDLRPLIRGAMDIVAPRASQRGLGLLVEVSPELPQRLTGDGGRLRQVLVNLLGNAVKFTNSGSVTVRAHPVGPPEALGPRTLRIEVQDTGVGVAPESQALLFQAFSQVDSSASRRYGGTGLGLAISRRLCERMGGRIGLESEVGKGSTFWFELPLRAAAGGSAALRAPELSGLRCVVVAGRDRTLSELLTRWGAAVEAPETLESAFELLLRAAAGGPPVGLVALAGEGLGLASSLRSARVGAFAQAALLVIGEEREVPDGAQELWLAEPSPEVLAPALLQLLERPRPAGSCEPSAKPAPPVRRRLRILVAEDNPVNQEVARLLLEREGHTVDIVGDGREAVEAVSSLPYDLVMMDIQMPVLDGVEATRAIRQLPGPAGSVAIIAMTANVMPDFRAECLRLGMRDFVPKPVERARLVGALRDFEATLAPEERR